MAAASYNTDLSLLVDSGVTSSFSGIQQQGGGAGVNDPETDYYIQDTECCSRNAWAGSWKGVISVGTALSTLSTGVGNAVYTWITHHTPGSLGAKSVGGIRIVLGSDASTYNEYYYAGSDTIDYGAPWIPAVIDPDQGLQTTGTVTTANIDFYGGSANLPSGGPTKGSPLGVDIIRFGRSIEINDGVGAPANFTDLAAQNDAVGNRWGQFQRTPGSASNFTMQCRIEFGDTTNTTACDFRDSNKNITINDLEFVASTFVEFEVTQASTVILENINFLASSGANTRGRWVSTSSTQVDLTTCSFVNMDTFVFDANTTVSGCSFRGCNQVTVSGATVSDTAVSNSTATTALLAGSSVTNLSDIDFTSSGTGHGLELTGGTSHTFNGLTFSNYGGGQGTSTGNEAVFVNIPSGSVTITADASFTYRTAGASVSLQIGQKQLTVTNVVAGSDVVIKTAGTTTKLQDDQDIAGTSSTYSYTYSAGTFVDVYVYSEGYVPYFVNNFELPANGGTIQVAQQLDRNFVP